MDKIGELPGVNMRESPREQNGGSIMTRVLLLLIVPTICGSLYLARNVWIVEERMSHTTMDVLVMQKQIERLTDRVIELERRQKP